MRWKLYTFLTKKPSGRFAILDEPPVSRIGVLLGLITFLVPFCLYFCTCMREPGIFPDYVEMAFIGKIWGIPHPPGFPLYLLINGLVSAIPVGPLTGRVACISVVAVAIASHFLYRIAKQLGFGTMLATATALLAASARPMWMQGVITDVYGMNIMFMMITLWALFRWSSSGEDRWLYFSIWTCIIGTVNYPALITVFPGLLIYAILVQPAVFKQKTVWLHIAGAMLAGIGLYSYIFFRSCCSPIYRVESIDGDLGRFWHYVSCAMFYHFYGPKPDYMSRLWSMFVGIGILTLSKPGWFASILGIYTVAGRNGIRVIPLVLIPTAIFLHTFYYHSHEPESRLSLIYPFATLLAVSFAIWLIDTIVKLAGNPRSNSKRFSGYLRSGMYACLFAVMVAGISVHVVQNRNDLNFAGPNEDHRKAYRILSSVEEPYVIVVPDYSRAIDYLYCMYTDPESEITWFPLINEINTEIKPNSVMYPWNPDVVHRAIDIGIHVYIVDRVPGINDDEFDFEAIDTGADNIKLYGMRLKPHG